MTPDFKLFDASLRAEARRFVFEAIALAPQSNEEVEARVARQLFAEEHSVDLKQVNATGAWVKIFASRSLETSGLAESVDPLVLIRGAYRYEQAKTPEARTAVLEEMNKESPCELELLRTTVERYLATLKTGESQNLACNEVEASNEKKEQKTNRADHANYDFEAKILWRQKIAEFIAAHMSPEERQRAKVLCLPSADPIREVKIYLDLGFRPENILGIEGGDQEARSLFTSRAKALGIRGMEGRLEDIVPTLQERFDVVSLDFPGQLCDLYVDIAAHTLTSPRALVLINLMAGRESTSIQKRLFSAHTASNNPMIEEMDRAREIAAKRFDLNTPDGMAAGIQFVQKWHDLYVKHAGKSELSVVRDDLGDSTILKMLGMARLTPRISTFLEPLPLVRRHDLVSVSESLQKATNFFLAGDDLSTSAIRLLTNFHFKDGLIDGRYPSSTLVGDFITTAACNRPHVRYAEKYQYTSEASKSHKTYYSIFAVVESPEKKLEEWRHSSSFLESIVLEKLRCEATGDAWRDSWVIRLRNRHAPQAGSSVSNGDLFVREQDLRHFAEIPLGRLFRPIKEFIEWQSGFVSYRGEAFSNIPRASIQVL